MTECIPLCSLLMLTLHISSGPKKHSESNTLFDQSSPFFDISFKVTSKVAETIDTFSVPAYNYHFLC